MIEKTSDYFPFNEGMPTGPDVELLVKAYPDLRPGDKIARDDVYALLGLDPTQSRGQSRMRSVMEAFKHRIKREKQHVILYDRDDACFHVATPADVIKRTGSVLDGIRRKARRQRNNFNAVAAQASDSERPVIEHQARLFHAIERDSRKAGMNLLPSTAAPATPQIAPPDRVKAK